MTPEERNLVMELFNRLATLESAQRDPEAERVIEEGLHYVPHAPYSLVQTVLVQDEALKRAEARIRELEGAEAEPRRDGGFLDTMRDSLLGRREGRGSVPSVRPAETPSAMSPAWRTGPQPPGASEPASVPIGSGGSFLGTAAAAAAGVIGGSLLLHSIRSMMGPPAHAAHDPGAEAGGSLPWSGGGSGGELARRAGLDDIGRSPSDEGSASRGHGLLDDSGEDAGEDTEAEDFEADDFDEDGFGFDGGGDGDE